MLRHIDSHYAITPPEGALLLFYYFIISAFRVDSFSLALLCWLFSVVAPFSPPADYKLQ